MDYTELLDGFAAQLRREEKSRATAEKYLHDAAAFAAFAAGREITKELTVAYKEQLTQRYAPGSVNTAIASLNAFLRFCGRACCRVKPLRLQRSLFAREEKELTAAEYERLLAAAGDSRIAAVIRTVCATGIRVSELKYITAEAVWEGKAAVQCKGKVRLILLPGTLCRFLRGYMKKAGIKAGSVFVTRSGRPLDRSNIWKEMKALCAAADVPPAKVFPHNLRHLFARTFYRAEKDLLRLADLLGHSSINTTRIYTMDTGAQHRRALDRVGAMLCTT